MKKILEKKNFSYHWGDGWSANIEAEQISGKDRRKFETQIKGFCGYEWMVNSIIKNNKIIIEDKYGETNQNGVELK